MWGFEDILIGIITSIVFGIFFYIVHHLSVNSKVSEFQELMYLLRDNDYVINRKIRDYKLSFRALTLSDRLNFNDFTFNATKLTNIFKITDFERGLFPKLSIKLILDIPKDFQIYIASNNSLYNQTLALREMYCNEDWIVTFLRKSDYGKQILMKLDRTILKYNELIINNRRAQLILSTNWNEVVLVLDTFIEFVEVIKNGEKPRYGASENLDGNFIDELTLEEILNIDPYCIICYQKIISKDNTIIFDTGLSILACCGSFGHFDHLDQWINKSNNCPYCANKFEKNINMCFRIKPR